MVIMPMEFNENTKPIYLQIADRICDQVTAGTYPPGERIPSVRALAAEMQVNFNTVMRSFEYLASRDIIANRRGVGYFITEDALEKIEVERKATFYNDELKYFFSRLTGMAITPAELEKLYTNYLNDNRQ